MVAYHFPPIQGSSGVLRTLSFARHLPEFGWEPLVLTVNPRAYPKTSDHQMGDIPAGLTVHRAFALDTARHLALRGAYLGPLAAPDRWWTWWLGAVPAGLRMIRHYQPELIWSTAPIATAHLIGLTLHRITGLPWVSDIRDLLTESNEPEHPAAWQATRWIERRTLARSTRIVTVTPGQRAEYLRQFPDLPPERIAVIPNGYDELAFASIQQENPDAPAPPKGKRPIHLVHSGVLYPTDRDPGPFFRALAHLIHEGEVGPSEVRVTLRASGSEETFAELARVNGLAEIVQLPPPLSYREALEELLQADGLLLFQGRKCGTAIPAKLYEYIRARRPLLALTDAAGATGETVRNAGYPHLAPLESTEEIVPVLRDYLREIREGTAHIPPDEVVARYSRRNACGQLAEVLASSLT
jgi:glycosyltransferase involved in cell wall biosynthesis